MKFFCDVTYDPFVYMQENDKVYSECRKAVRVHSPQRYTDQFPGFTISLVEWEPTIPTLWSTVKGENTWHSWLLSLSHVSRVYQKEPGILEPQQFFGLSIR